MRKIILSTIFIFSLFYLYAYEYETEAYKIQGNTVSSKVSSDIAKVEGTRLKTNYKGVEKEKVVKNSSSVSTGDNLVDYFAALAMEEVQLDVTKNGVFSAGAKWPTAWTRDMSYAIDLSLAFLFPDAVEKSLASRVENNMILQDTGSGGSYPVSTDRVVWIIAAYDYALVKQDPAYFEWVYQVAKNTLEYDYKVNFDPEKKLFKGESSFLDWREQTYPRWCTNEYIANSYALGTNVVYQKALSIMVDLSERHGKFTSVDNVEEVESWKKRSADLKEEGLLSNLWIPEKNYFAALILKDVFDYKYEGYETLGESLAVLNGIVSPELERKVVQSVKPQKWGMSVVAPQFSRVPSYHNDAVWPFVQGYRALACKKAGAINLCEFEFASMLYAASMFQTFKENYVASSFSEDTQTNSDRQLWSDAGFLSMIYRVIFGIDYNSKGISINPLVFDCFNSDLNLKGLKIGNNVINLKVRGKGDKVVSYKLDGKDVALDFVLPYSDVKKEFNIEICVEKSENFEKSYLDNGSDFVFDASAVTPLIPNTAIEYDGKKAVASWKPKNPSGFRIVTGDKYFKTSEKEMNVTSSEILGVISAFAETDETNVPVMPGKLIRVENKKNTVFLEAEEAEITGGEIVCDDTEPADVINAVNSTEFQASDANKGYFVKKWGTVEGESITFTLNVKKAGEYVIDFRFQNGHGPNNTGEKCAIRSLSVDDKYIQKIVFPQVGKWSVWSFSAPAKVCLSKGTHKITLYTDEYCYSQHHIINYINLDLCRVSRIK